MLPKARCVACGLHVDCCLGGFLVPFMGKAGFDTNHDALLLQSKLLKIQ